MQTFYQKREHSFLCSISKNLTYPAHLHKQIEIIYVLSGSIHVTINKETQELFPGDMAVSFPNLIHSLKTNDSSRIILLIFDSYLADINSGSLSGRKPECPFILKKDLHPDIPYGMNALLQIAKPYEEDLDISLIKGFLTIILCRLLEKLKFTQTQPDDLNLVHQILVYIDDHITEPLTLELVAKKLNTSKFYLSRIFNHQLNSSFNLYLNNQRIQMAQYLLVSTELSITEIAFQSGFESMRTFYRAFKGICKMAPREYRMKNTITV